MRWLLWCFCLLAESYETINHYRCTGGCPAGRTQCPPEPHAAGSFRTWTKWKLHSRVLTRFYCTPVAHITSDSTSSLSQNPYLPGHITKSNGSIYHQNLVKIGKSENVNHLRHTIWPRWALPKEKNVNLFDVFWCYRSLVCSDTWPSTTKQA